MRISGQILDLYDDQKGEVLKDLYPTPDDLPEVVKQAHALSPVERQELPDDVFTLVLVDDGNKFRKFACTDPGNTVLSIGYFLKNAHKLPEEARQLAAENLKVACSWYGIEPPEELEKAAVLGWVAKRALSNPLGTLQTAYTAPALVQGMKNEIGARNSVVRGSHGIVTPHEVNSALGKQADVVGTSDMPTQVPDKTAPPRKATIDKVANEGLGHLVTGAGGKDVPADTNLDMEHGKQPPALPQMRVMHPSMEVTGKEPKKPATEKKASLYALAGKYPLDSYTQVKEASAYFDTYAKHFSPSDRREYCQNLVKRADALGIEVSFDARKYGSSSFASEEEVKMAFDARRSMLEGDDQKKALLDAIEKRAKFRAWRDADLHFENPEPWLIVECLSEFDKQAGLDFYYDRGVPDPFYSVYGEKTAESAADYSWTETNDMVTGHDLERLARVGRHSLHITFGEEFAKEFTKDPITIFKSMPSPQKKLIARMANDTVTPVELGL